jgi:hypothetical protein
MPKSGSRIVRIEDMTLDDLIEGGVDIVSDRLPKHLLLAATRKFVQVEAHKRERQRAQNAERRAYGMATANAEAPDNLMDVIREASLAAARQATMTWRPLLDIPFLVPTKDLQTTWGRATTDMHFERAAWLENIAVGNVRTASHHRKAIEDIASYRVNNLLEAVSKGAD